MRRSIRLALAILGLGLAAYGALQYESTRVVSESRADPAPSTDAGTTDDVVRLASGTITHRAVIEDGFLLPWQWVATVVVGLALTGYALFGRLRRR
jgi:hypothetical protein